MSQHRRGGSLGALPAFQSAGADEEPQPLGFSVAEDKLGGEYAEDTLVRLRGRPRSLLGCACCHCPPPPLTATALRGHSLPPPTVAPSPFSSFLRNPPSIPHQWQFLACVLLLICTAGRPPCCAAAAERGHLHSCCSAGASVARPGAAAAALLRRGRRPRQRPLPGPARQRWRASRLAGAGAHSGA